MTLPTHPPAVDGLRAVAPRSDMPAAFRFPAVLGRSGLAIAVAAAVAASASLGGCVAKEKASATAPAAKPEATATATATATAGTPAPAAATAPPSSVGMRTDDTAAKASLFRDMPTKGTPKLRAGGSSSASTMAREGSVVTGSVNVYTFDPKENYIPIDASTVSLAQVLGDLGEDAAEWYQHVQTLSNPWFEGRAPGSDGIERAAQYCEFWMKKAGLEPAFADANGDAAAQATSPWRQPFDLPGRERRVKSGTMSLGDVAIESSAARALRNSGGGTVELPVTFVGYAIESGRDGFAGIPEDSRLDGRIAFVLRGEPLDAEGKSRWGGEKLTSASSLAAKFEVLRRRGAAAVVVADAPGWAGRKTDVAGMSADALGGELPFPCFFVDAAAAAEIARSGDPEGRSLEALRALADESGATVAFRDDAALRLKVEIDNGAIVTHNVGGILRGKGALADQWIVIGAHYDHVGFGAYGADPANRGKLHPGADDNASGTSGMLVLTRRLAKEYAAAGDDASMRSVLFLAFSAEELGLNGSRWFVRTPSIPADKVDIMLNLDMIGRSRGEILVGGVETADGLLASIEPFLKASGLLVRADPSGRGPSDHAPFYGAGIPVLFFFTGVHDSYHKPGDMGYSVDPRGIPGLLGMVEKIALWRAKDPERLVFATPDGPRRQPRQEQIVVPATPTPAPAAAPAPGDRGYAPVRLGIQPGPTEDGESGLLVLAVTAGTSAADAGIVQGDVLLSWNGAALEDSGMLAQKLREHKPGDVVKMRILRDGKELEIDVTLKASNAAQRRPQND